MSVIIERAKAVHGLGIQPWPVKHDGTKAPRIGGWSAQELPDRLHLAETLEMFKSSDTGMGVLTGGVSGNLELLEFEGRFVNSDGYNEFLSRCEDEGLGEVLERLKEGYEVVSPTGGIHLLFRTDGPARGNLKLARRPSLTEELEFNPAQKVQTLIETRGEGGFAILAGSNGQVHPNGGKWDLRSGSPAKIATLTTDERELLYELASTFDEMPAPRIQTPGLAGGDSDLTPLHDWVRNEVTVAALLIEDGWKQDFTKRNGETLWVRPGKNARDGHSASLFADGGLNVYSSSVSAAWTNVLIEGAFPFATPIGVLAAVRFDGDISAAMSWTRKQIRAAVPTSTPPPNVDPATGEITASEEAPAAGLNLPDEFWEQQPFLRAVAAAADAGLASRDAVLGSALTRISTMVPPATKLPAIVGSQATLDLIAAVVADSSGGKTISNGVAKRLIPIKGEQYLTDQSPGSGEGLIEAFLDQETNDKGKKVGPKSYKFSNLRGLHLTADEGTGLQEQAGRSGTTIMQTLCSAWSGAQMGQLNASVDTKRIVPGGKRRVALTINIQTKNAHMLFEWVHVGLPQRVLFCWAHGELPEDDLEFPATFLPSSLPMQDYPCELTVADEIQQELRAQRRAVASGKLILPDLDGHRGLLQLKVAALLSLADGRRDVTVTDWGLAQQIVDASARVRDHVGAVASAEAARTAVGIGRRQGMIQVATDEHLEADEKQKIAALAKTLVGKVEAADGQAIGTNALRKATCSAKTKHRFDPALDLANEAGCVELIEHQDGNRVEFLKAW